MSEVKGSKSKDRRNGNFFKILIVAILMIIACFAGYFVFIKYKPARAVGAATVAIVKPIEETSFSADEFTVNLADNSIMRTKIILYFEKANTKLGLELDTDKAIVRDAIISVIRSKKSSQLITTKSTDDLKGELIKKINSVLVQGKITHVYYYDILIQ